MAYFAVDVLTPYKVLAKNIPADGLFIPTTRGEINVLPHHTHIISQLETGILKCVSSSGSGEESFMVTTGIVKVLKNKITVLAQVAEKAQDIDVERAKKALEMAKSKISSGEILDDEQLEKYRRKLARALVRTTLASK
ncbi:MAG: ATP synthase F1 subunit epsilon [Bacteriovoracales bacterium]|nr:ATP synthase F1 subunit epsilon [Bacteriovoracales bacterium]